MVLSTLTVTTNADSGVGSLRQAIATANANGGDDVIVFNLPNGSTTINLTTGPLVINSGNSDGLLIDGTNGGRPVTINAINNVPRAPPNPPAPPTPASSRSPRPTPATTRSPT